MRALALTFVKRNQDWNIRGSLSEIIGGHIVHLLPLSQEKVHGIERAFSVARQVKETTQISYDFDPFANNPNMGVAHPTTQHFNAEITPMFDAKGAPSGFFVKVTQRPSFHGGGIVE